MNEKVDVRIEVEAIQALIHWKSRFADEIVAGARRLAAESGEPQLVTLAHYRQAAQIAVQSLSTTIVEERPSNDGQKAA